MTHTRRSNLPPPPPLRFTVLQQSPVQLQHYKHSISDQIMKKFTHSSMKHTARTPGTKDRATDATRGAIL